MRACRYHAAKAIEMWRTVLTRTGSSRFPIELALPQLVWARRLFEKARAEAEEEGMLPGLTPSTERDGEDGESESGEVAEVLLSSPPLFAKVEQDDERVLTANMVADEVSGDVEMELDRENNAVEQQEARA